MVTKHNTGTDTRHAERILLIVELCGAGQALRVMPYVLAVREARPDAHITVLVNEDALEVFARADAFDRIVISRLYTHLPHSVLGAGCAVTREFLRLLWQLGTSYDLVLTYYGGSGLLHLLGYIGARLGRGQHIGHSAGNSPLLSCRLGPFYWAGGARVAPPGRDSEAVQHIEMLRAAGIATGQVVPPTVCWAEADEAAISQLLQGYGLERARRLIVLHPGSDWACQQWLPDRWALLADELVKHYDAALVFTGTRNERSLIETIQGHMKQPSVSLAGQTTLPQVAALLARSWLCVCVDSAVFELTQATGIPVIVLAGPTRPQTVVFGETPPIVVNHMDTRLAHAIQECKESDNRISKGGCLNYQCPMAGLRDVSVADVLAAVEGQLEAAEVRSG